MLLATPYIGVATAYASHNTTAKVFIVSQSTGLGSTLSDGANTTVKISANVTQQGAGTNAGPAIAAVRFSYQIGAATPVVIGTDNSAPFSIEWPAAAGTYTEIAEGLAADNTVINTTTLPVTVAANYSSVHISSPSDGGTIGRSPGTANGGTIVVSGTRSSDLPALSVTANTRDNVTQPTPVTVAGAATPVAAGVPSPTASNAWTAIVAVPACPTTSCDVFITAVATGASGSDEVVQSTLYNQTLTTFTVTPPSANKPVGAVESQTTYTVTALDQFNQPVGGVPVTVTDNSATATETPASGNTDAAGVFTFVGANTVVETATYTVQSGLNGAYDALVDFSRTATLTTYTPAANTLALSADPLKALYASQTEYTNSSSAGAGDPQVGNTPIVDVCSTDQNGNPLANSAAPPANLITTVTRTTTTGTTTSAPVTTTVTPVQDTRTGKGNCYAIPHAAATGDYGTDTFNAYYERNGSPGFNTTGVTPDIQATAVTLKFATLSIAGVNNTQAQSGSSVTTTFTVAGADGTPFAGRKISLSQSGGTFPTVQPSGTTFLTAFTATCVTDAQGQCQATISDGSAGTDTITATDNITQADQIGTGATKSTAVSFRNNSVALVTADNNYPFCCGYPQDKVIRPSGTSVLYYDHAQPGDAVKMNYRLFDVSGNVLRGVSTLVSLDHGFFTPTCVGDVYTGCTFTPAISDGAPVGNLKNLGTTTTVTSDDNGDIFVTMAIARDAGFDDNGIVNVVATLKANGGTAVNGYDQNENTVPNSGNAQFYGWSTSNAPYNGASVKMVSPDFSAAPSGNHSTDNSVPFLVTMKDQFGNLTDGGGCVATLAATGNGSINSFCGSNTTYGSYTSNSYKRFNYLSLNNATPNYAGESVTVTATWPAPVTKFKQTSAAGVTPVTYNSTDTSTSNKTDQFTVTLYDVDFSNLTYTFASTPGNTVPVNTAVSTSVTVKDQKGNPVSNLCVQFIRSGPNDAAGNSQTGGTTGSCSAGGGIDTNSAGKAGTQYSSGTPGTATVTVIVDDGNGNELSRGVQNVTFTTGTPSQTGEPSFTINVGTILIGQCATLRSTSSNPENVLVKGAHAAGFTVIRTLPAFGAMAICPSTNSVYQVSNNNKLAPQKTLLVKPVLTLVVSRSGQSASFAGHIAPSLVGRSVQVFAYIDGGHVEQASFGKTVAGGNYSTSGAVNHPGKLVHFFTQTYADDFNTSGRSRVVTVQF